MHFLRDRTKAGFFARWLGLPGAPPVDTSFFPKGKLLNEKFLKKRKKDILREITAPDSAGDRL